MQHDNGKTSRTPYQRSWLALERKERQEGHTLANLGCMTHWSRMIKAFSIKLKGKGHTWVSKAAESSRGSYHITGRTRQCRADNQNGVHDSSMGINADAGGRGGNKVAMGSAGDMRVMVVAAEHCIEGFVSARVNEKGREGLTGARGAREAAAAAATSRRGPCGDQPIDGLVGIYTNAEGGVVVWHMRGRGRHILEDAEGGGGVDGDSAGRYPYADE
ncbi:hypothetical protein CPB84DRAFT_1752400 [Gymnopilus junonius]|uniref:Uncharacterized protein n=1 Tax=Gymnopilus junonius TaxID=109634 RepID=A0A9P5TG09_GYMJU|nr:hypothetical protein CPB84DRAFT_1752400 [Gymnopilus junonius]